MPEKLSKMARCPKCNKIKNPDFEDKEKLWYSCSDCDQYWASYKPIIQKVKPYPSKIYH